MTVTPTLYPILPAEVCAKALIVWATLEHLPIVLVCFLNYAMVCLHCDFRSSDYFLTHYFDVDREKTNEGNPAVKTN